jgi:glycosyltransferase involved in cell wall biosynthesis
MTEAVRTGPPRKVVCFPYVGDTVGGSHVSSLELIKQLEGTGWTPLIVVHQEGALSEYLRARGFGYTVLPLKRCVQTGVSVGKNAAAVMSGLGVLSRFLRKNHVSVVHTNDNRMHRTWAVASRLCGVPHVVHQRTPFGITGRQSRFFYSLPTHLVAISRYVAASCPDGLKKRLSVIDNPFDTGRTVDRSEAQAALHDAAGLKPEVPVIGMFGNLHERKRPVFAVRVLAEMNRLRSSGTTGQGTALPGIVTPEAALVVFGRDPDGLVPLMERTAEEAGVRDNVVFMGFRPDPVFFMAGCDVLLAPAVREPFGRTLVEAMSAGTPVVATDEAGHREIVTHNQDGFLVPADDLSGFAASCAAVLEDPDLWQRVSGAARRTVISRFSLENHLNRILRIYHDAVES